MIRKLATWSPLALALALAFALTSPPAKAGVVYLLNDEEIEGDIVDVGIDYVVVKIGGGRQSIPLREVRDVTLRSGESIYASKLKDALQKARKQKEAEIAEKRARDAANQGRKLDIAVGQTNASTGIVPVPIPIAPPTPVIPDSVKLTGSFDSDAFQFSIRFPGNFQHQLEEKQLVTFKDPRGGTPWTFNATFFDALEEGEFDMIRGRAQAELDRIPAYRARQRQPLRVGGTSAERTIGLYERAGRSIRHDQIVVPTRRGVLVLHFFSPGATLDDAGVPDVEAVIRSIALK